jgi:hypothetical protein
MSGVVEVLQGGDADAGEAKVKLGEFGAGKDVGGRRLRPRRHGGDKIACSPFVRL